MKSFRTYTKKMNERERLISDIFEIDENETEIMFSDNFKERLTEIFNHAVQKRIESEYDIIDDDVPETVQNEDYIFKLASRI